MPKNELDRAKELFFTLLNECYESSEGNSASYTCKDKTYAVNSIYYDTKQQLKELEQYPSTQFLQMSVLESALRDALRCMLVKVDDLLEGKRDPFKKITELREIFADNPWKKMWEEQCESYKKMLTEMGFTLKTTDYQDLSLILEPMVDALTILEQRQTKIFLLRDGAPSKQESPYISTKVALYASELEFVDTLMKSDKDALITFGAVQKTYGQIQHVNFYHDIHGDDDPYIRNSMVFGERMTREEAINQTRRQIIYLGIRNGDRLYLVEMPVNTSGYGTVSENKEYIYGKRSTFSPYQIFYKEIPSSDPDTSLPIVRNKSYALSDIMDDMQKIWLPIMLNQAVEHFFKKEQECERGILPETVSLSLPEMTNLPVPVYQAQMPDPMECMKDDAEKDLYAYFKIETNVIQNRLMEYLPLPDSGVETEAEIKKELLEMTHELCMDEIASRLCEWLKDKWSWREEIVRRIWNQEEDLIERAKTGEFESFSDLTSKYFFRYGTARPFNERDGVQYGNLMNEYRKIILWSGDVLKKPVYIYCISPKKAADFAALFGVSEEELPDYLRLQEAIKNFNRIYGDWRRFSTTEYNKREYEQEGSICLPSQVLIHICMGVREQKSWNVTVKANRPEHSEW